MIELKELQLENFISHKSTTIDMDALQGLIMVDGHNIGGKYDSNGAGKSTILEGIVYNLSGETLRKMGVNGMINRKAKKNTSTRAKLSIGGVTVDIERYRGHEKHGDGVHVVRDGQDLTKRLNKETQGVIDSLLGISYRVLTNTIFLGEGLSSKFTQLSDGDKKSLIESTLNLDYDFNKSRDAANVKLKKTQSEISVSKGRITSLEGVLADLDRAALTAKVNDLGALVQASRADHADETADYQSKYAEYNSLNTRKSTLSSALTNISHLERNRKQTLDQVTSLKQLWSLAGQGEDCVVCKQATATPDAVHNAQSHYRDELQKQGKILEGIQLQISGYEDKLVMESELKDIDPKLQTLHSQLSSTMNKINHLSGEISRMDTEIANANDLLSNADRYESEVSQLKDNLKLLESSEAVYAYWYAAFSPAGLLVRVLEEAVNYLNDRVGIYSEMLLDRRYSMKLGNSKLTLVGTDNASYETLSNGEKRRLDLAIQFGLHDYVHAYCGLQIDTLFIDEVLDTLDSVGISNIIDILRIKLSYCNLARIFVITHNADLKSYFDRVLLVSKDKDGYSNLQII